EMGCPRIIEIERTRQRDGIPERRSRRGRGHDHEIGKIVRHAKRRANGGLAVAARIERQTDARSKLVVTILHSRLARETGVAGVQKPGRGILEDRVLTALRHRLYLAEQEIQHADTRSVSGKSETRRGKHVCLLAVLILVAGKTKPELMGTADQAHVIR